MFRDELLKLPDEKLVLMAVNFYRMSFGAVANSIATYERPPKERRDRLLMRCWTIRSEYHQLFKDNLDALTALDDLYNELIAALS